MTPKLLIILTILFVISASGQAQTTTCYLDDLPEHARPNLLDVYPLLFLSKGWKASAEMKSHFNRQKAIFKLLDASTLPGSASESTSSTLASVGDLMRLPGPQSFVDQRVIEYLDHFDWLLGNLETLITEDQPVPPDSLFLMNSDPALLESFTNTNEQSVFTAVSLANNHLYDFDDLAIEDTLSKLQQHHILQSGIRKPSTEKPYLKLENKGIKIGYYAVTTLMNNMDAMRHSELNFNPMLKDYDSTPLRARSQDACSLDLSGLASIAEQMNKDGMDFKVLSLHWGFEHEMYPRPEQMQIARNLAAFGYDVIFGSHTHSPQPAEICFVNGYEDDIPSSPALTSTFGKGDYCSITTTDGRPRKSIIFYSLGNFTSYTNLFWQQLGTIASLTLSKTKEGKADWHSPHYRFTYDHTFNPPNDKQYLTFLDEEGVQCPWQECAGRTASFMDYPKRHMLGSSLGTIEQLIWGMNSLIDTIGTFIYWKSYSPQKDIQN